MTVDELLVGRRVVLSPAPPPGRKGLGYPWWWRLMELLGGKQGQAYSKRGELLETAADRALVDAFGPEEG